MTVGGMKTNKDGDDGFLLNKESSQGAWLRNYKRHAVVSEALQRMISSVLPVKSFSC